MKFNVNKMNVDTTTCVSALNLIEARTDIQFAFEDLTAAQQHLSEVRQIVANIDTGIGLIAKYQERAIPILNLDNGLTDLIGSTEFCVEALSKKLSTAKIAAMEGFVDSVKAFIKKLIEFVKNVLTKIKQTLFILADDKSGLIDQITNEQVSALIKTSGNRGNASNGIFTRQGFLCFEMHNDNVIDFLDSTVKTTLTKGLENIDKHRTMVHRCVFELKQDIDKGIIDMSVGLGKKSLTVTHAVNEIGDTVSNIKEERDKMVDVMCHSSIDIRTAADLKAIYKISTDYLKKVKEALFGLERDTEEAYNLADKSGIPPSSGYHQVLYECARGYGMISGSLAKLSNCLYSMTRGCQKFAKSIVKNTKLV